ncbi:hypothetical protein A0J61_02510 [Choanephora cucurbitarum]|uniref:SWIRM domain-containing protein n=1 Tax=Choanephora cucurbitarum TaxID=101091 RepID=A0A1C7NKV7_9FUNG|nr:hypothetical protein A0J61_02510 [Choanephora cucurbitarum]
MYLFEQKSINKQMLSPPTTFKDYLQGSYSYNPSSNQHQNCCCRIEPKQEHCRSTWVSPYSSLPSPPTYPSTVSRHVDQKPSIMAISSIVNETSTEIITSRTIQKQKYQSISPNLSTYGAFTIPLSKNFSSKKHEPLKKRIAPPTIRKPKQKTILFSLEKKEVVPRQQPTITAQDVDSIQQDSIKNTSLEKEDFIAKKSTEAALLYDRLSAEMDINVVFKGAEEWIPSYEPLDRKPAVRVQWKGHPLKIKKMPYYEKLHRNEASMAAILRLTPEQFLKCKWALILAAKDAYDTKSLFRKSEAQKVCCIDVNKTSALWNAFGKLGWLGPMWPQ